MASLFGMVTVETPKFTVLKQTPHYQIRKYPALIRIETPFSYSSESESTGTPFRRLAGYIFGDNNETNGSESRKIAMTAPVQIAMTAPVQTTLSLSTPISEDKKQHERDGNKKDVMAFIVPSEYTVETLPVPNSPEVHINMVPSEVYAVMKFSGRVDHTIARDTMKKLKERVEEDGVKVDERRVGVLNQYNPPWTIWFLRTNEVMVPVRYDEE